MNSTPVVHVYTICWNEERVLPYFLRHYSRFARRIIVYDNYSTDTSPQIVRSSAVTELRYFGLPTNCGGESERVAVRQNAWQESRESADWVIVVDCDEFLWHPVLLEYLSTCHARGITVPRPTGYEMFANEFPDTNGQIFSVAPRGLPAKHMDKWVVFDPRAVQAMNYGPGSHQASPVGRVVYDDDPRLKLLHYRHLGLDYTLARYQQLAARRTDEDRRMNWNFHYELPAQTYADWFRATEPTAHNVLESDAIGETRTGLPASASTAVGE